MAFFNRSFPFFHHPSPFQLPFTDISHLCRPQYPSPPLLLVPFSPYFPFHSPSLPSASSSSLFNKKRKEKEKTKTKAKRPTSFPCDSGLSLAEVAVTRLTPFARRVVKPGWLWLGSDPLPNAQQFVSWHYGRFIQGRDGLLTKDPSDLWLLPSSHARHTLPLASLTPALATSREDEVEATQDAFEQVSCGIESDAFYGGVCLFTFFLA